MDSIMARHKHRTTLVGNRFEGRFISMGGSLRSIGCRDVYEAYDPDPCDELVAGEAGVE